MNENRLKRARVIPAVLVGLCLLALAVPALLLRRPAVAMVVMPTPTEVETVLRRAGLGPETLAAAGAMPSDAGVIGGAMLEFLLEHPGAVEMAHEAFAGAKREHDRLVRRVRSGRASDAEIAAIAEARVAFDAARSEQGAILESALEAAIAGLPPSARDTVRTLVANRDWHVSTAFKVLDRSQRDWVALRDALANERIAASYDEPMDVAAQSLLAEARGHPAVAAAQSALDTNLEAMTLAWDGVLSE